MDDLLDEAIEAGRRWLEAAEKLEEHDLGLRLVDLADIEVVRRAWQLLTSDAPLSPAYPSGERATPPYTPRQVLTLANAWPKPERIAHNDDEYDRILLSVREALDRNPARRCEGYTRDGWECRLFALPYVDEPVRCHHHSTDEARSHNREMLTLEEKRFHEMLGRESRARVP